MNVPETEIRGLLEAPVGFWKLTKDQLKEISNGGGPKIKIFGVDIGAKLVPDSMYWMSMTDCFDIHDYDYYIKTKRKVADPRMYRNLRAKIDDRGGFFKYPRRSRAWIYYQLVDKAGSLFF